MRGRPRSSSRMRLTIYLSFFAGDFSRGGPRLRNDNAERDGSTDGIRRRRRNGRIGPRWALKQGTRNGHCVMPTQSHVPPCWTSIHPAGRKRRAAGDPPPLRTPAGAVPSGQLSRPVRRRPTLALNVVRPLHYELGGATAPQSGRATLHGSAPSPSAKERSGFLARVSRQALQNSYHAALYTVEQLRSTGVQLPSRGTIGHHKPHAPLKHYATRNTRQTAGDPTPAVRPRLPESGGSVCVCCV